MADVGQASETRHSVLQLVYFIFFLPAKWQHLRNSMFLFVNKGQDYFMTPQTPKPKHTFVFTGCVELVWLVNWLVCITSRAVIWGRYSLSTEYFTNAHNKWCQCHERACEHTEHSYELPGLTYHSLHPANSHLMSRVPLSQKTMRDLEVEEACDPA